MCIRDRCVCVCLRVSRALDTLCSTGPSRSSPLLHWAQQSPLLHGPVGAVHRTHMPLHMPQLHHPTPASTLVHHPQDISRNIRPAHPCNFFCKMTTSQLVLTRPTANVCEAGQGGTSSSRTAPSHREKSRRRRRRPADPTPSWQGASRHSPSPQVSNRSSHMTYLRSV